MLAARERSDGAFLVRFSESHPTKFTLSYLKVHPASSRTPGRRELKNCLVRNLGKDGYALTEAVRRGGAAYGSTRQRTYPSIGAFIQASSNRLKYGVASEFAASCNQELAAVRALQDQQSDAYSAFSTESFGQPEPPPNAAATLFSRSPPTNSLSTMPLSSFSARATSEPHDMDNYSSFSLTSLAPTAITRADTDQTDSAESDKAAPKTQETQLGLSSGAFGNGDYGSFASFTQERCRHPEGQPGTAVDEARLPHSNPGVAVADEYASLASLTSTLSQQTPQAPALNRPMLNIYGAFTSLSIAGNRLPSQDNVSATMPPASGDLSAPPPTPNLDVYGSFDSAANISSAKTTPTTSALDELNVGMEFYKQKRLDDALLRFMLAQEMARATGDQVVEARALGNLGTVFLDKKNPQQAVRCYQQCLDITRAIEDTKRERTILNNLVLALVASEDFERALACCQVQLETTTNAINRRKIISRMSLIRERLARQQDVKQPGHLSC